MMIIVHTDGGDLLWDGATSYAACKKTSCTHGQAPLQNTIPSWVQPSPAVQTVQSSMQPQQMRPQTPGGDEDERYL